MRNSAISKVLPISYDITLVISHNVKYDIKYMK